MEEESYVFKTIKYNNNKKYIFTFNQKHKMNGYLRRGSDHIEMLVCVPWLQQVVCELLLACYKLKAVWRFSSDPWPQHSLGIFSLSDHFLWALAMVVWRNLSRLLVTGILRPACLTPVINSGVLNEMTVTSVSGHTSKSLNVTDSSLMCLLKFHCSSSQSSQWYKSFFFSVELHTFDLFPQIFNVSSYISY